MESPRVIGHIVSVQGFRVKVELLPETKSAMRATLDGVQVAVAINSYLTFSLGAGQLIIGIITDLEARESYDPTGGDELTLELIKPRRVASVQLLGTIEQDAGKGMFSASITILPTLDTPAEIGSPEILKAVFETPPRRNKPDDYTDEDDRYDCDLRLGFPTGQPNNTVRASYNDMFSRPLAIVGNTGSGKSFSVSSLIQKAMSALNENGNEPHIFILDINGEYSRAFPDSSKEPERKPDRIYLNGVEFGVPIWLFNAEEICAWLSAAEQTQEPVLKDWWAIAKAGPDVTAQPLGSMQQALSSLDHLLSEVSKLKRKNAGSHCDAVVSLLDGSGIDTTAFKAPFASHRTVDNYNAEVVSNPADIIKVVEDLAGAVRDKLSAEMSLGERLVRTADSPFFISLKTLMDPSLVNRAVSKEDSFRVEAHLTTLKLRLKTRLDDRRWRAFLNYEDEGIKISGLEAWLASFGLGEKKGPRVSVLDLSMLSHEVLPYACSIVGRLLLEVREALPAASRYKHPWVLVLEEAHNYVRPSRSDEDRGHKMARSAFERIAKEGRKFGISLIIASQRPSEISQTIISQCANFISHRLQNPDDIDHFRRIIPMQARRLLDQVTILNSGEAIVFGSAFHVPTRVQFDRPNPGPHSQTAAPFYEWNTEKEVFPLNRIVKSWGMENLNAPGPPSVPAAATKAGSPAQQDLKNDLDDEIPF